MVRRIAGRGLGAAVRGVAAVGMATAGVMGLAARQGVELQSRATRLAIKGGGLGRRVDPTILRQEAEGIAGRVRGTTAGGVLAAQERFVAKTGRLDLARTFSEEFAKISIATGTEMDVIGSAAADMFEKFDVKTADDMANAMSILAVQGKRGAFEMEDAAKQFPKIAAAAQRFGLRGVQDLATLGGLTQIARRATPSGEEAGTAVEAMFKQIVMKSDVLERKFGTKVFKDKGKTVTRDIRDILVDAISGAKGNLPELQKIFDVRGIRAVSPLISLFNQSRAKAMSPVAQGGRGLSEAEATAVAIARLRKEIDDATNVTDARAEMEEDAMIAQKMTSAQLTAAWESVVAAVNSEFTPVIIDAAGEFAQFVMDTDFSRVIQGFSDVANAAIAVAEALNIIGKKKKTPEELIREGERELKSVRMKEQAIIRKHGGPGGMRSAEARARALPALQALAPEWRAAEEKIRQARGARYGGVEGSAEFERAQAGFQRFGMNEFVQQMKATGVGGQEAQSMAMRLMKDPSISEAMRYEKELGWGGALLRPREFGENLGQIIGKQSPWNEEQQRLIQQFAEQQTAIRTVTPYKQEGMGRGTTAQAGGGQLVDVDLKTEAANTKLGQLAGTAETVASALQRIAGASALSEAFIR
jgi:hypothetical protein